VIAYDRRGYGGSGAPEPYGATTVHEQTEDAAALVRALDAAPAIVAGADFGALVVLDLLVRHPGMIRGAVLLGPPLYAFVAEANEALATERARLEEAVRSDGPEAAVERWLPEGASAERRARARVSHRAFFADYGGLATWPVTRAMLRGISVPVVVLDGERAAAHDRAAADALTRLLPAGRRASGAEPLPALRELLGA
jgi:pimeloyl-ACP methyl ester carboxylesterase